MKKPGLQKRRTPGGGAAGRAYQFEQQRDVEKANSQSKTTKEAAKPASKKTTKKKSSS